MAQCEEVSKTWMFWQEADREKPHHDINVLRDETHNTQLEI